MGTPSCHCREGLMPVTIVNGTQAGNGMQIARPLARPTRLSVGSPPALPRIPAKTVTAPEPSPRKMTFGKKSIHPMTAQTAGPLREAMLLVREIPE
jgi:hypothetical protein